MRALLQVILLKLSILSCLTMPGCFYFEAAAGQLALINRQTPLVEAIPQQTDPQRKALLSAVPGVLAFARDVMLMDAGESYQGYVELPDRGLTYVLVAAEKTKLEPYRWWFPFAGEVEYKSFFRQDHAQEEADELSAQGYDVYLGQSRAYSTLGYLRDPIVSSMLDEGAVAFVEVVFHELAHRRLYVAGQTEFNEQLASFVAERGCERFFSQPRLANSGLLEQWQLRREKTKRSEDLIEAAVKKLTSLYDSKASQADKLRRREIVFERLAKDLDALRTEPRAAPEIINNARLLQFVRYGRDNPDLQQLWESCGRDFRCFWAAVEGYSRNLPPPHD